MRPHKQKRHRTAWKRRSRSKRDQSWDKINSEYHDLLSEIMSMIDKRNIKLSRTEIKIAALLKGMLSSREIAEKLHICEETVDNHRSHIRKRMGLAKGQNLYQYFATCK